MYTLDSLSTYLNKQLKYESCIDEYGHIFPSRTCLDIAHFYFVKSKIDIYIHDVEMDNFGGMIIYTKSKKNHHDYKVHIFLNGVILFEVYSNNELLGKVEYRLKNNKLGFGTDYVW